MDSTATAKDMVTLPAPPGCTIQATGSAFRMEIDMPGVAMPLVPVTAAGAGSAPKATVATTLGAPTTQDVLATVVLVIKAAAGRWKPIAV